MFSASLRVLILLIAVAFTSSLAFANLGGVVFVDRPTGDPAIDVPNIEAAIAAAEPGETIQFRRGTYRLLEDTQFFVPTPGVTLQGARIGRTTLRATVILDGGPPGVGIFTLLGGNQTVRNFRFRDIYRGVATEPGSSLGGYLVENCVFRNGDAGVDMAGFSDDISIVRKNRFINMRVGVFVVGKTVHVRKNFFWTPDPEVVLGSDFSSFAVSLEPDFGGTEICENNVIERNLVLQGLDGVAIFAFSPGQACRNNVIRDNYFRNMKVPNEFQDGSMVVLAGSDVGVMEGNIVEGNKLEGSEGLGIVLEAANDNRIIDNEIEDLPGEKETFSTTFLGAMPGTGIFLEAQTVRNIVDDNELEDVRVPILDLGDNFVGENDIEQEDERVQGNARAFSDAADIGSTLRDAEHSDRASSAQSGVNATQNENLNRRRSR